MSAKIISTALIFFFLTVQSYTSFAQVAGLSLNSQAASVSVDPSSGSASLQIHIDTPPGRAGIEPNLNIVYSSSNRGLGNAGVGWNLDLGSISRSLKRGIPKYDSTDTFQLNGVDLIYDAAAGYYRTEIEGGFAKIEKTSNGWLVTDKKGIKYTYYSLDSVGQYDRDRNDTSRVFRWFLTRVEDVNGNNMGIFYVNNGNQIYPQKIVYTGNQQDVFNGQVIFAYNDAKYPSVSYGAGFRISSGLVFDAITVYSGNYQNQDTLKIEHKYKFNYSKSLDTDRELLSSLSKLAADGTAAGPAINLKYTTVGTPGWKQYVKTNEYAIPATLPAFNARDSRTAQIYNNGVDVQDMNGDGYADFISSSGDCGARLGNLDVYLSNKTNTWNLDAALSKQGFPVINNHCYSVYSVDNTAWPFAYFSIYSMQRNRYGYLSEVKEDYNYSHYIKNFDIDRGVRFLDVDGDGDVDMVQSIEDKPQLSREDAPNTYLLLMGNGYITQLGTIGEKYKKSGLLFYNGRGWSAPEALYNEARNILESKLNEVRGPGLYLNNNGSLDKSLSFTFPQDLALVKESREIIKENYNPNPGWMSCSKGSCTRAALTEKVTTESSDVGLGDINGDGYVDMIKGGSGDAHVYFNVKGRDKSLIGWEEGSYPVPNVGGSFGKDILVVDMNGDGLVDMFHILPGGYEIFINTGRGFEKDNSAGWKLTIDPSQIGYMTLADLNADGLPDLVLGNPRLRVYINTGNGFMSNNNWTESLLPWGDFSDTRFMDVNGDGLVDVVKNTYEGVKEIYLAPSKEVKSLEPVIQGGYDRTSLVSDDASGPSDMLYRVDNGLGVTTTVNYTSSLRFNNTFLPFPLQAVKSVTTTSGIRTYTTTYNYSGGLWDKNYREFVGFKSATVTDVDGNYTTTSFDQRHFYKGRAIESATYDSANKLLNKTINTWDESNVTADGLSKFIFLKQSDSFNLEGQASGKRSAQQMFYDAEGNTSKTINLGEVDFATGADTGTDSITNIIDYAPVNSAVGLKGMPRHSKATDQGGATLTETWFYYDGAADNNAMPSKGQLTRKEDWQGDGKPKLVTTYAYDAIGNLTSTKDALGKTTSITYDTLYKIFPVQTTNALNQIVKTYYYGVNESELSADPKYNPGLKGLWGQVMAVVDANGQKVFKSYDAFGRLVKTYGPLDSFALPTTEQSYSFGSNYVQIYTKNRITSGQAATIDSSEFYDGLGRLIQSKKPAPTAGQYIVSNQKIYNNRGLVEQSYVPQITTNNLNTLDGIPPDTVPHVTLYYDAQGRKVRSVNADGSFANAIYEVGKLTSFDESGHKSVSIFDINNRLITREEYTGADGRDAYYAASAYTLYARTNYQYDIKGNLTKVTDAKGNVTTISYDALGRKTSMNDPDMHAWSYSYDANGNLLNQKDANTKSLSFTYDALNRLKTKTDFPVGTTPAAGAINVSYIYDNTVTPYAKGRLSSASYSGGDSAQFVYDQIGREKTTKKTINGINYQVDRAYDDLNRITSIKYPDGASVKYGYNLAAQVNRVYVVNADATNTNIINNITYNVLGQITKIYYANGAITTYVYNSVNFRLARILSLDKASAKLQDLNYSYDKFGNIVKITDAVNTGTQTLRYDALKRLVIANGAYGNKTYTYDQIGNIIKKDGLTYTYKQAGAGPHAVTATSDGTSYRYDANGNMISKTTIKGKWTYVYDTENRLISIGYAPGLKIAKPIANYYYDGDGGRVKKVVYRYQDLDYSNSETYGFLAAQTGVPTFTTNTQTSVATVYVGNLYEIEDSANGNPQRKSKSLFLGSTRIASITGSEIAYYHQDHLGSANVMSDKTGLARSLTEYDPFGKISRFEKFGSKIPSGWQYFHDKSFDDESGLSFFGGRYYDSKLGRFITADTIVPYSSDPQSFNRYSYCRNNPVNIIDPSGHKWSWSKFWKAAVAAVVSAVVFVATGGTATPVIAGFWAGMAGGAVAGALSGGGWQAVLQGAAFGALTGAVFGAVGSWGVDKFGSGFGWGMLSAAGGYSAATGNLDSFAGGVVGGLAGAGFSNSEQFKNFKAGNGFVANKDLPKPLSDKFSIHVRMISMAGTTPQEKSVLAGSIRKFAEAGVSAVEEQQSQWAKTIKAEAPGWTKGIGRAQALSRGAAGIGVVMDMPVYSEIYSAGSLGVISQSQMYQAMAVHTGAIAVKMGATAIGAGLGGMGGSLVPVVGTTYGATTGAVAAGGVASSVIDGMENSYLDSLGVR